MASVARTSVGKRSERGDRAAQHDRVGAIFASCHLQNLDRSSPFSETRCRCARWLDRRVNSRAPIPRDASSGVYPRHKAR